MLDAAVRQARSLDHVDHRPWPLPAGGWATAFTAEDAVFVHRRVSADVVRVHVPVGLDLDTHDGDAWLGIVALRVTGLRARGLLPLPGISSFLAIGVRTYVTAAGGKPGIWSLGLDASSRLVVETTRLLLGGGAFHARMSTANDGEWIAYDSARASEPGRVFSARFRPHGVPFGPEPGSPERFFVERYCLYATDRRGRLCRAEIHHEPWELRVAEPEIGLASVVPVEPAGDAVCHVGGRRDVVVWPPEPML